MSKFKFYKGDVNWIYNEGIVESVDKTVPAGHYRRSINGTKVEIKGKDSDFQIFSPSYAEVTEIQRSATPDDNYSSVEEFIAATEVFFAGSSTVIIDKDGELIDENNPLPVITQPGVPATYSKQTSNNRAFFIQKGQLNNFRIRPAILNEHVETSRQLQSTVTSGNIVGQIFKASQDNINGISLTLQSGDSLLFDDFESYADSAALQVEWVSSDLTEPAELETVIVYEGTKSMMCPSDADVGTEWKRSFDPTDFAGYTGTFHMYNDRNYSDVKMRVFVEDSIGNTNSELIVNQDQDTWKFYEFDVDTLPPDGGVAADLTDIVSIGFRLVDRRNGSEVYFDDLISFLPPASVDIELWDMGTDIPIGGITSIDDGTQYEELGDRGVNGGNVVSTVRFDLKSGKRQYYVRAFAAGTALEIPSNTILNEGNYYALVLKYVNGKINVFGTNTSFENNYYLNGYAFTAPDESTPITTLGQYNDLQFAVYSTQSVKVNTLLKFYDAQPGNDARELINIEDNNMNIIEIVLNDANPQQVLDIEFKDRTLDLPKGGKFEVNLNDDFTDSTTQLTLIVGYMYEPPTVNG